jgi:hypothetical protein
LENVVVGLGIFGWIVGCYLLQVQMTIFKETFLLIQAGIDILAFE